MRVCIHSSVKHKLNTFKTFCFKIVEFQSVNFTFLFEFYLTIVLMFQVTWLPGRPWSAWRIVANGALSLPFHVCTFDETHTIWGTYGDVSVCCCSLDDFMFYLPVSICASSASGVQVANWSSDWLVALLFEGVHRNVMTTSKCRSHSCVPKEVWLRFYKILEAFQNSDAYEIDEIQTSCTHFTWHVLPKEKDEI